MTKLKPQLMDEQYGFRPRRGVDDCVFAVKRLQEAFQLQGHPLYMAFLDITKAYDSVPREALFRVLQERYGVDAGAVRVLRALYTGMQGRVRVGAATSTPFAIDTGVRQGCILSPLLFAVYLDFLLRSSLAECRALGIEWTYARDALARAQTARHHRTWIACPWCRIITMILYADDMVVWADSAEKLQQMVAHLSEGLAAGGLLLSAPKSKIMVTGGARGGDELERPITINGEALEVVEEFKYLGSVISADGTDKEDLRQRIGRAWGAFYNLGQTLLERRMGTKLRGRILYTSVVAVLLHGCEHWRLTRQMEADLVKAHHGMQLGLLRLTRKAAAERHITRAEARLRTGAHDILGLLEKRKIKRGTKLMQVHRSAPSLPSILLAGEPAMLRYPVGRGATGIKFGGGTGHGACSWSSHPPPPAPPSSPVYFFRKAGPERMHFIFFASHPSTHAKNCGRASSAPADPMAGAVSQSATRGSPIPHAHLLRPPLVDGGDGGGEPGVVVLVLLPLQPQALVHDDQLAGGGGGHAVVDLGLQELVGLVAPLRRPHRHHLPQRLDRHLLQLRAQRPHTDHHKRLFFFSKKQSPPRPR